MKEFMENFMKQETLGLTFWIMSTPMFLVKKNLTRICLQMQ